MALVFVVPMPPTVSNRAHGSSRHWRVTEREKSAYWEALRAIARMPESRRPGDWLWQVPTVPDEPLAYVEIASSMVLRGAMDDDNAVTRHKWLVDWLVRARYLACDRRKCVRWAAFPDQRVSRKEPARITLTVTAVGG